MKVSTRWTALVLAGTGLSILAAAPAQAGSNGRQNTALALGALAAYGIVKKKPELAGIAGAAAVYSYVSSRRAASSERERDRRHRRAQSSRRHHYVAYNTHDRPSGWSRGRKVGWHGYSVPPGHAKKMHCR